MNTINTDQISVQKFANHFIASVQCKEGYKEPHLDAIEELCKALPHGSGLDGKMEFQPENSKENKLCFYFEFHHMDENGYYCGWTEHNLVITPSLRNGFDMKITGSNRNDIKDYLYQVFQDVFVP